ncbi:hypothetical protein D3C71_2234860 [compost metagenome]
MPEPAEINRYLSPGWRTKLKSPSGPKARSFIPGFRCSNIQRVPMLSDCALTVTAIDSGREGVDDRV